MISISEINRLREVMKLQVFKKDPLSTIQNHLVNSIEAQKAEIAELVEQK